MTTKLIKHKMDGNELNTRGSHSCFLRLLQRGDASPFQSSLSPWHLSQHSRPATWLPCPLPQWSTMWCTPATERFDLPTFLSVATVRSHFFSCILFLRSFLKLLYCFFPPHTENIKGIIETVKEAQTKTLQQLWNCLSQAVKYFQKKLNFFLILFHCGEMWWLILFL